MTDEESVHEHGCALRCDREFDLGTHRRHLKAWVLDHLHRTSLLFPRPSRDLVREVLIAVRRSEISCSPGRSRIFFDPLSSLRYPTYWPSTHTVASPNPVPRPSSFVVKNGSKIRARVCFVIPIPV